MNGTQESRNQGRFRGSREHADGTSYQPTRAESPRLHRNLDVSDEKIQEIINQHEKEKSEWIQQESRFLEQINKLKEEVARLKHQLSIRPDISQLTPQQPLDPRRALGADSQACTRLLQRLVPQIRALKNKINEQNKQIKDQRIALENLKRKYESSRGEPRRFTPSMESSAAHLAGMSNSYTLSLTQSAYPGIDRLPVGATADDEKYNKFSTDSAFATTTSDHKRGTFDPHGPVESSNHDYDNQQFSRDHNAPRTLVSENINKSNGPASPSRKRRPKPMPRLRSIRSQAAAPSSQSESFEKVDKAASAIPNRLLDNISEKDFAAKPSNSSDRPTWLTQNVISTPFPETGYEKVHTSTGRDSPELHFEASFGRMSPLRPNIGLPETAMNSLTCAVESLPGAGVVSSQICDVCHKEFPDMANRQFLDHCLECAERAAALEGAGSSSSLEPTGNRRDCPLCPQTFGPEVSQTDFENHVQSHFRDEEARAAGWEHV